MSQVQEMLVPHLRHLDTYQGVDPMEVLAEQAGIPLDQVIRLNGNENPYGPSPKVVKALGSFEHYNHYPDPGQRRMRECLSEYLDVAPDRIVCGNGSDELIDMLLECSLAPAKTSCFPRQPLGCMPSTLK